MKYNNNLQQLDIHTFRMDKFAGNMSGRYYLRHVPIQGYMLSFRFPFGRSRPTMSISRLRLRHETDRQAAEASRLHAMLDGSVP